MASTLTPSHAPVRLLRLALAVLGALAIYFDGRDQVSSLGSFVDFISYFTIESNVLAVVVFTIGSIGRDRRAWWDRLRGLSTFCMIVTGVVYAVLLATSGPISWTNVVLHRVLPVAVTLDWLALPTGQRLGYRRSLLWLLAPLLFSAYSLIRGPFAHWYPYSFLNPGRGYARVATYCVVLAAAMALLALVIVLVGNARRRLGGPVGAAALSSPAPRSSAT
ncbi:MAG: hypothetical protein JWN95_812 [Frankiales bacterium]|nr:hypothetical protein [Frankiales bacterium]